MIVVQRLRIMLRVNNFGFCAHSKYGVLLTGYNCASRDILCTSAVKALIKIMFTCMDLICTRRL